MLGKQKVERLMRLAKRTPRLMVTVDSEEVIQGINEEAKKEGCVGNVLVELYQGRTGVQSPEEALALTRKVVALCNLSFQGLMIYPSRIEAKPFIEKAVEEGCG